MRLKNLIVIVVLFLFIFSSFSYGEEFDFDKFTLLKPDPQYVRRDPSDIIKVGDYYYLYYSKMTYKKEKKKQMKTV